MYNQKRINFTLLHLILSHLILYLYFPSHRLSVTMSSMSAAFGISVNLLDSDLSHYIAAGRISAKIDRVGDVIEAVSHYIYIIGMIYLTYVCCRTL